MRNLKEYVKKYLAPTVAKRVEHKITRRKKPDTMVFASFAAIGDLLYSLAFLEEIKKREPARKIVVLTLARFRHIVESFGGYDELVLIPDRGLAWFRYKSLVAHLGLEHQLFQNNIIIGPWAYISKERKDESYIQAMRTKFGLKQDTPIHYHAVSPKSVTCIPQFEELHTKVVVLNPYSRSENLDSIETTFFEQACALLTQMGYIVYTNTIKNQMPIRGSKSLHCSLEELLGIASKIPLIVSIRSGILDYLIPTGIHMFVIYNNPWFYTWYNLSSWNGQGVYKEILGTQHNKANLMSIFKDYLTELGWALNP